MKFASKLIHGETSVSSHKTALKTGHTKKSYSITFHDDFGLLLAELLASRNITSLTS